MSEKEVLTAKKEVKPAAQSYTVEKLRENCSKVLGISRSTFDGAMRNAEGPLAIEEAKRAIDKWNNAKIKKEGK